MPMTDPDLLTASYQYHLPPSLIAHQPAARRDQSRLLVMEGDKPLAHRRFTDLLDYLSPGDCLVQNDTRVIPARLYGRRKKTGGAVEFLLLSPLNDRTWRVLVKPGRNARTGEEIVFGDGRLTARVQEIEEDGARLVTFTFDGEFMALLDELGEMPLPPYIHEKLDDPERYQTVYAREKGSAAAPTAGLHFTPELLSSIEAKGVAIARLTLHVGVGTFKPVKEEIITRHPMHKEPFTLGPDAVETILATKARGGRVIGVGTTSLRVLESLALENSKKEGAPLLEAASGETELFVYPGFQFRVLDGLVTNFHLPGSTLLMLVSALMGRERILAAYQEAVEEHYRFFSFGDACLLLPD